MKTSLHLILSVILLSLVAGSNPANAQQTFSVTVVNKTSDHPRAGEGFPEAYAIDGEEGAELTLTRGETYTFQMDGVPSIHPFYITDSNAGAGAAPYDDGVTGNGASGSETLTFTPPDDAPDLLYYQCVNHQFMGYRINIVTGTDAEVERAELPTNAILEQNYPNPFNPETNVTFELARSGDVSLTIYDASGRQMRVLVSGQLSAGKHTARWDGRDAAGRAAPSGVYLLELRTDGERRTRTMTLIR